MESLETLKNFFTPAPSGAGLFLSFEGIEGSGKSTQIELLKSWLLQEGHQVSSFREPGGTAFGEKLREAMLGATGNVDQLAQAYLFASSRAQLLSENVLPRIKDKKQVVILDRYFDSTIAYQGIAFGLGVDKVLKIHQFPPLNITPHISFYLRIDLETSMERQEKRGNDKDFFESQKADFYQKLIEGYDLAAKLFPERISIIDGAQSVERIQEEIRNKIQQRGGI